jgi:hypothetical protein
MTDFLTALQWLVLGLGVYCIVGSTMLVVLDWDRFTDWPVIRPAYRWWHRAKINDEILAK